ncbi:MAG: hypothetical protein Q4F00_06440 [bacterium]|nr:hypothetical protein [bacterium]
MAINPALGASMNIQANYAVTSTVNTYDTPGVWRGDDNQPEESSELSKQQQTNAQQEVGGAKTSQTSKSQSSQETQQTSQSGEAGAAAEAEADTANSEVAARTLRLSMADNSKELQAKFNEAQATNKNEQQPTMTQDARRQVMLRNMENMVNLQLAQYTGNEPYSKANYREILGAVTNMQGDGKASKAEDDGKVSDNGIASAEKSEEKDGVYKLYSGQAAKTLASLNNPRGGGDDSFDLVA